MIPLSFNRTILELKLQYILISKTTGATFNRTILELKPNLPKQYPEILNSFNRTILELKHAIISYMNLIA